MKKITKESRLKIRWLNTKALILLFGLFLSALQVQAQTYCIPVYSSGCGGATGDNLNSVVLNGHGTSVLSDLNTGCSAGAYDDKTALTPVDLMQSVTYPIQLNTGYGSPTSERASVWIDFNNNGTFEDATEKLLTDLPLALTPAFATGNITIPLNAPTGVRRMRVRVVWSTTGVNACANASFGEVHDYRVNILALPPCSGTPTAGTASVTPTSRICASQPFTLTAANATIAGNMTYQWERADAGTGVWGPILGATNTTYTVTNQTVASDYRFVVNCVTSSSGNTSNIVSMSQPAPIGVFYEDFNTTPQGTSSNGSPPTCWTYLKTSTSSSVWGYTSSIAGQTGNGFYTYRPGQSGTSYSGDLMLISPETANLGAGTKQIRFSARRYFAGPSYSGTLKIYTMNGVTATSTKTLIATINVPPTITWNEWIVPLPNTTDDYFAFSFEEESLGKYIFIDDVYYEDLSPCGAPGMIGAISITATGATVNWNKSLAAGVTGYDWEVRDMSGVVVRSGTISNANTVSAPPVTGLTPGTYYEVFVRSKCGTTNGTWTTVPFRFATLCTALTGNFFEGFENTPMGSSSTVGTSNIASQPLCWSYIDNTTGWAYTSTIGALAPSTQGFYAYRPNVAGDLLLVSPETVNLGAGNKRVRFSARVSSTSYITTQKLEVLTMNGNTATATKTVVATGLALTDSWQEFIVYLPNTTDDYFAFSFDRNAGISYYYIDNIYYEDIPPLLVSVDKTDILCNGASTGTVDALIEGGKPPYTYSWAPSGATTASVANLPAGTHTVTVTDNRGTVKTASVTLTQPTLILQNLTFTNISCNGKSDGSASVAPSGGVAPYTVLWSDGKVGPTNTNMLPGAYSVTVRDANGCPIIQNFTINEPALLTSVVTNQSNVTVYGGNDGSATLTVTGGTAPYTYSWSPSGGTSASASNLVAGTYNVLVTDTNGCTITQSVVITQPPIPYDIVLVSQNNVTCNGANNGSITINVTGGTAPYNYVWSNGGGNTPAISNLSPGNYTLTVTDAFNEVVTASYTITEPAVLSATIGNIANVSCNNNSNGSATVTAAGGTAPYTYFWSNGMTTSTANNLGAATFSVTVTDANGCTATSTVSITQPADLVLTATSTPVSCNGLNDGSATISVNGGSAPYTYLWTNGQTGTNISSLLAGTYDVTVTDANGCSKTETVIVTQPAFVHPPVGVNQSFCTGQNATLANVVITGSNIKWYSSATGGTLLPTSTALANGVTYYASQTVGVCESSSRTAIQISLGQGTPISTTQLNVCSNTRVQNIIIGGLNYTQLKWYSSATSTTELPSSQLLATGAYYISSYVGNCESARQAVQVIVAAAVAAPTASSQVVCVNSTLDDLVVVKDPLATLRWYSSQQSMTPLANTTVVSNGTYYVQQVIGNCESVRVAVPVQVVNISAPSMTSIVTCEGITIAQLHPTTGKYLWYINNSTTTALPETFVVTTGTYYLATTITGCTTSRTSISVIVNPRPNSPTGQLTQHFEKQARVLDLVMNQPNVLWFASYDDAVKQVNPLNTSLPLQDQTTYYGILTGTNNCGSMPTPVLVTLNLSNTELDLAQLKYYPNPAESELNISYIEEIKKVEVFTITGQRVLSGTYQSNEVKVDLTKLSSGTYLVKIETAKASQFVKVIKK